jgi:hypothetical protein
MENLDQLSAVGTLIGQQVDQLWSIAMAVIVAEIVVVCSFFKNPSATQKWRWSERLMLLSILAHAVSLLAGYFAKGAVIELVKNGSGASAVTYYDSAALASLWQFFALVVGLALFVVVFVLKRSDVSSAILGAKG